MRICKNCNEQIEEDSKYCKYCGNNVGDKSIDINFILENHRLFIKLLQIHYPFVEYELESYSDKLQWGSEIIEYQKSPGLSSNENIEWSDLLIEQYSHRINFNDFLENKNIIWDYRKILKFKDYFDFKDLQLKVFDFESIKWSDELFLMLKPNINKSSFSLSQHLNWSVEFIKKNQGLVDWNYLSRNKHVPWSLKLIDKFKKDINWRALATNPGVIWDIELYNRFKDKVPFISDFFDNVPGIDINLSHDAFEMLLESSYSISLWSGFSANKNLKWSPELIKRFENHWNWDVLCFNPAVPWTIELIRKYKKRIKFDQLSGNESIVWTVEILEEFGKKLRWSTIEKLEERRGFTMIYYGVDSGLIQSLPLDFIEHCSEKWNWKYLSRNPNINWTKKYFINNKNKLSLGCIYSSVHFKKIWDALFKDKINASNLGSILKEIDKIDPV